jgi:hypothetical protein
VEVPEMSERVEAGLEGTIIGKVRLLMRKLDLTNMSPAEFLDKIRWSELQFNHLGAEKIDELEDRIEALKAALREIEDCLGYVRNEGKSVAIRECNSHSAWKIARAALDKDTEK